MTQERSAERGPELLSCPLCRSPYVNLARDLAGNPEQAFCKVCGCCAPIAAWNRRPAPPAPANALAAFLRNRAEDALLAASGATIHVSDHIRHARLFNQAADHFERPAPPAEAVEAARRMVAWDDDDPSAPSRFRQDAATVARALLALVEPKP